MSAEKGSGTQIIIAIITAIGVLGGALLANWDKVFPSKQSSAITPVEKDVPLRTVIEETPPTPTVTQPAKDLPQSEVAKKAPIVTQPAITPSVVTPTLFTGNYTGFSTEGFEQNFAQASLQRNGDQVNGRYTINQNVGSISGTVNGNTLHYYWKIAGYSGQGILTQTGRQVTGTWGYGNATSGAGQTQMQQ